MTGIYKLPTIGAVQVSASGAGEDFICDPKNHGGPDQAIYIYGEPDYAWWVEQLGREVEPGTFGENLTISGFSSATHNIGDRLQIGSVLLEFTAPRFPCSTLAARMRDPLFVKKYRRAERPGMYCRVIQAGTLQAGDQVTLLPAVGKAVAAMDVFRDHYEREKDEGTLRRFLEAPVSIRTRAALERNLSRLLQESPR